MALVAAFRRFAELSLALTIMAPTLTPSTAASEGDATANCVDPPVGMTAWWGGDGNAADVFGTHAGTLVGDTTFTTGWVERAFSFDGAGDRVDVTGSNIGEFGAGAFTVSFWMNTNVATTANHAYIIGRSHPDGGQGWDIRQDNLVLRVSGVDGWAFNIITGDVLIPVTWQHIALVAEADGAGSDTVTLYVDGVDVGNSSRGSTISTGNPMRFGLTTSYGGIAYDGLLDEVQIYDRALSLTEVQAIRDAGADGNCRPCAAEPVDSLAWWRAEDDTVDAIGDHDGTLGGGVSYVDGKVGRAFSFDGSTGYVEATHPTAWNFGTGSFSLVAWIRSSGVGDHAQIMCNHNGSGAGALWTLWLWSSGVLAFAIDDDVVGSHIIDGSVALDDGYWHHIVALRDAAAGEIRLYVDGEEAAPPVSDGGVNLVSNPDVRMAIGSGLWGGGGGVFQPFPGEIDEAMIIDRALTIQEIHTLANSDRSGICLDCTDAPSDLVSWWEAEDGAGDTAGSNHGTMANGAGFADGLVGRAFSFPADDDHLEVADDPSLSFAVDEPMSVDLWVYRTGAGTSQHILGKRTGCSGGPFNYQIVLDPGGGGICFAGNDGGIVRVCSSGGDADLPLNEWTHIAATFDGADMNLFLDGQEAGTASTNLGTPDSSPLRIGTSGTCGAVGQGFVGLIDEVEIHDRALSRDEVYAVYSAGAHGKCDLPDTVPDSFAFTDQTLAVLDATVTSDPIIVSGINAATPVMISACSSVSCEFSVNGGGWSSVSSTVMDGESVEVRQRSAAIHNTTTDLTLDIGGVTDTFSVTTIPQHSLSLSLTGSGTGSVTSAPAGINCPAAVCTAPFDHGQSVTLTPVPDPGSTFTGFTGDTDCGDGEVLITAPVTCTGKFSLAAEVIFIDGFESGDTGVWAN